MRPRLSPSFVAPLKLPLGPSLLLRRKGCRSRQHQKRMRCHWHQQSPAVFGLRRSCDTANDGNNNHCNSDSDSKCHYFSLPNTKFGKKDIRKYRRDPLNPSRDGIFSANHAIRTKTYGLLKEAKRSIRRETNHRNQFQTEFCWNTHRGQEKSVAALAKISRFELFPKLPIASPSVRIQTSHVQCGKHTVCVPNSNDREHRRFFSSETNKSTKPRRRRSPYAVLGLRNRNSGGATRINTIITKDDIKAAFRKLAKAYHPDLNLDNRPLEECEFLMSELVEAYERLLRDDETEDDFLENIRVGASNKVAVACELYSVDELIMDRFHNVHALKLDYTDDEDTEEDKPELVDETGLPLTKEGTFGSLPEAASSFTIPIKAHPGDSVSDLKGRLELEFASEWDLDDCLGWELLSLKRNRKPIASKGGTENHRQNCGVDGNNKDDPSTVAVNNEVLSYHLFLDDYQIQHGDTIYAVVRKNDE